jgi:transposase
VINPLKQREHLNRVGAIRLGHLEEVVIDRYDTVNGDSIVAFLQKIRAQYSSSGVIKLVLDGVGYHRFLRVKDEAKKQKIESNMT